MRNKTNHSAVLFFAVLFWSQYLNSSGSIDGTSTLKYLATNQVLRDGEYARGFVKLNSGVTILGDATASFNITDPMESGLDLRETGIISLDGNLYLDSNFTITSNGVIRGNGKTIFMGGDLTLSDSNYVRVLHINSDTIIDGCGHSLITGRNAQLFVDDNVTLTLKNMIIKPTFNHGVDPCIKLSSNRSKLAFDNVKFDLVQDFDFTKGQLFIHNDVAITGTSAFIYRSSQPSFITSAATLYFDSGTTFFVEPSTFTDCKFDQFPTYTSNNFIKMADKTSQLYLNGCNLNSTFTGCRFTKGTVNFENNIDLISHVDSIPDSVFFAGSHLSQTNSRSISWSPCGRFMAVVNYNANSYLQIFSFDGSSQVEQIGSDVAIGGDSNSVAWSPDGKYIAALSSATNSLQIFSFDGLHSPFRATNITTNLTPMALAWAPDGRFIVVVGLSALQVFSFDGFNAPIQVGSDVTIDHTQAVSWASNGKFIASVNYSSNTLQIFSFDGVNTPSPLGTSVVTGNSPDCLSWSPDDRFIAVSNWISGTVRIFSFNGYNSPVQACSDINIGTYLAWLAWSPCGRFIAILDLSYGIVRFYYFNAGNTPTPICNTGLGSVSPSSVEWSPDGKFVGIPCGAGSVQVHYVNYVTNNILTQAMSNGIVFGDSAKGESYDPTVNILGSAYVEGYGLINYDCPVSNIG